MDRYRPRVGRIVGGVILLFLTGFILWFIAEGFLIFTPLAKSYAVRGIGGYYVKGEVTRLRRPPDEPDGDVLMIEAEYSIGFQRVRSNLPPHLFYYEGLEEGDSIAVPFSQKDFDDMRREDRIVLAVSVMAFAVFFIWCISVFAGEIAASRYFRRLILNKTYIYAQLEKSEYRGNKVRAVCGYGSHGFKSRWYSKERYPFQCGGAIRVYVDLSKDENKYLISEK